MFVSDRDLTIEFGDCDPDGTLFVPRLFALFDGCVSLLLERACGLSSSQILARHGAAGWPVIRTGARLHAPCRFGDRIRIRSGVIAAHGAGFDIEHRLTRDGSLAVEGRESRAWTLAAAQGGLRAARLPAEVAEALRSDHSGTS